jgi:two-component system response regulator AtoC
MEISASALPESILSAVPWPAKNLGSPEEAAGGARTGGALEDLSIKRAQRLLEAGLIRRALERTAGNRSKAAELLELSPRALLYKIREYGLE